MILSLKVKGFPILFLHFYVETTIYTYMSAFRTHLCSCIFDFIKRLLFEVGTINHPNNIYVPCVRLCLKYWCWCHKMRRITIYLLTFIESFQRTEREECVKNGSKPSMAFLPEDYTVFTGQKSILNTRPNFCFFIRSEKREWKYQILNMRPFYHLTKPFCIIKFRHWLDWAAKNITIERIPYQISFA